MVVAKLVRDEQFLRELLANSERKQHLAEAATAELKEKLASTTAELKENFVSARKKTWPCRLSRLSRSNPLHSCSLHGPAGVSTRHILLCSFRVVPLAGACECPELKPWPLPGETLPRRRVPGAASRPGLSVSGRHAAER